MMPPASDPVAVPFRSVTRTRDPGDLSTTSVAACVRAAFWFASVCLALGETSGQAAEAGPKPAPSTLVDADMASLLKDAARVLPRGLRQALATKPSPYIVKAHDVGPPTDFNTDIPWHSLEKEKDPRFPLPYAGRLGLVNTNSDVNFLIGLGVDDGAVNFSPPRVCTDHLINLIAHSASVEGVRVNVLFLPMASDTVMAVLQARNGTGRPATLRIEAVCTKTPDERKPFDRYGYGIHVTTGRCRFTASDPSGAQVCAFDDWERDCREPTVRGTLLCTLAASEAAISSRSWKGSTESQPSADHGGAGASLGFSIALQSGQSHTLRVALNLHRYGPERFETRQQIVLYPKQTDGEAQAEAIQSTARALRANWPALVCQSYRWYAQMPVFRLPPGPLGPSLVCALELPRGNTWSAQDAIRQPWYTFCRAHGHNPYGWWSYGMHGHEHLTTFVTNLMEPALSQSYLRGHFQVVEPDGFIQYGVNHRLSNCIHSRIATCPFLAWQSWTAYLWSGDRVFLDQAYKACGAFVRWWRSPARTRAGTGLQHWKDFIETVRDDGDLATWTATGKASDQQALDINCYLLQEERTLAQMARELGRAAEAAAWDVDADRRTDLMRQHLWHAEDRVYYGKDIAGGRWARILDISTFFPLWCGLATRKQVARFVELLADPQTFGTKYPVATLAVNHMPEHLRGVWHWRGANWVQMTWLAIHGLKRYGCYDRAAQLAAVNSLMVADTLGKTGHFREFYNTLTGEPSDLTDYIWTSITATMIVDVIFGIRPTAEGIEVLPALPEGEAWSSLAIENLRIRGTRLSVHVRRAGSATNTTATLNGQPCAVHAGRGVLIPWEALPPSCEIRIRQPSVIIGR